MCLCFSRLSTYFYLCLWFFICLFSLCFCLFVVFVCCCWVLFCFCLWFFNSPLDWYRSNSGCYATQHITYVVYNPYFLVLMRRISEPSVSPRSSCDKHWTDRILRVSKQIFKIITFKINVPERFPVQRSGT